MSDAKVSTPRKANGHFKRRRFGKYNAQGDYLDGHWFPSAAERERYIQLKALASEGKIDGLELQPSFPLRVGAHHIATYKADFRYFVVRHGELIGPIIEDVKGMVTPEYKLKRNLAEAIHSITIIEVPGRQVKHCAGKTGLDFS
jgi:Protein of unknown function (DUF1064)